MRDDYGRTLGAALATLLLLSITAVVCAVLWRLALWVAP